MGLALCPGSSHPGRDGRRSATGFVFAGSRGRAVVKLDVAMRSVCTKLGAERATPHDLRRTFSTTVTGLGFGRDRSTASPTIRRAALPRFTTGPATATRTSASWKR